jgi:hypothetical protein
MLDRYPPGIDIDAQGRTLRTASQDTFVQGMNVISQDLVHESTESIFSADNLWSQAWEDWQVEVVDQVHNTPSRSGASGIKDSASLDDYIFALDVLSAGDVCFGFCMRPMTEQLQDPSAPPMREKTVSSHALALSGRPDLLQAEPLHDCTNLDKELAIASHVRATGWLACADVDDVHLNPLQPSTTDNIIDAVMQKSCSFAQGLSRNDFSQAFDVLAADADDQFASTTSVTACSFDREFSIIVTDLAPYIRAIAQEFQRREEEQLRMSSLLSAGGGRQRQTRNAFAAMDGGRRGDRRARYYETWRKLGVVVEDVMRTGGKGWHVKYGGDGCGTRTETASAGEEMERSLMGSRDIDELH